MAENPITRGLFLCENLTVAEGTRNVSLVGCFEERLVDALPVTLEPFWVYARLVNGSGRVRITLSVDRADGLGSVYEESHDYYFRDPLTPLNFQRRLTRCRVDSPGRYSVTIEAAGDLVAQTSFDIRVRT